MKYILTIAFALLVSITFAQSDSTKTDTVKVRKKNWVIELNDKQQAAMSNFDQSAQTMQMQFQIQYNAVLEQKNVYLKAILEGKKVDVNKITEFKYENGKLTFIETKEK